ncbi:MAG: sensor histidine kinase [Cyclobacteriaceae bacterium]
MWAHRDFILGKGNRVPSRAAFKTALLRGNLSIITFVVAITYIFIDHAFGVPGSEPYYLMLATMAVITFLLNRNNYFQTANLVFLTLINLFIFYFSAIDPFESGVFMYFVVCGLIAFALLGYHNLPLAFGFLGLSILLFIISFWVEIPFLPRREYTEEYLRISYTTNFLVSLVCSVSIIYFLMDISHHSEKELIDKNELLQKANDELDRFVYSASHDLKAPLSSMRGLIDIAQRSPNLEEVNEILRMMQGRILHLNRFIADIIDYSRNSRTNANIRKVPLQETIQGVVDELKYIEGADGIGITVTVDGKPSIETDEARLKVILNNLVSNSIRHHDPTKANRFIRITVATQDKQCCIQVQDNGCGIGEEHTDKIFEMFYRASEKSTGSGLGLYIVKETVAKLGGLVSFTSRVGEGTTFTVVLPF